MSFVIRCGVAPRAVIARRPRLAQLDNDDDLIPPDFGTKESVENVFIYFVFVIIFLYLSLFLLLYFLHISQQLNLKSSPFTGQPEGCQGKSGDWGKAGGGCSLLPSQLSEDNSKTDEDYKS